MRTFLPVAALFLSISTVAAQPVPYLKYTAESNVGLFAIVPSRTQLVSIPAGQILPRGLGAVIVQETTTARCDFKVRSATGLEASMFMWGRAYGNRLGVSTEAGTTTSRTHANLTQGPTTFVVQFTGRATGTLDIYFGGRMIGQGSHARVSLDIDADGSFEYNWSVPVGTRSVQIPFSVNPVRKIRVVTDCRAFTTTPSTLTGYELFLSLNFKPFTAKLAAYGNGCGPRLSGTSTLTGLKHNISLRTDNAIPNSPVLVGFSLQTTNLLIPGTACSLLTLPFVTLSQIADSTGSAVINLNITGFYLGSMFVQAFPWNAATSTLSSSNGLEIKFGP